MTKTIFRAIIGICIVTSLVGGYFAAPALAKIVLIAYGGQVIMANPALCTCSAGVFILYKPAIPSFPSFLAFPAATYIPAMTRVYSFYNMFGVGIWHKGQYVTKVQGCYLYVGFGCTVIPTSGIIFQVGTSGVPGKL